MKKENALLGVFGIVIVCLLIMPGTVSGTSYQQAIAGDNTEDPGGDAYHPQDDSFGDEVVSVYTKERYDPVYGRNVYNIRIGYSYNNGANWQNYEWVSYDASVEQDFADIHVVFDWTEPPNERIKLIAVWQERPYNGNGPWVIKGCVRDDISQFGQWGQSFQISSSSDNYNNIYPKVDFVSMGAPDPGTFYTVVWQRYYSNYGTYGIKMNSFLKDSFTESWRVAGPQDIACPTSSNENYRHPAVACNYLSGGDAEVHIAYDALESSTHRVRVESGYISGFANPGNQVYVRYNGLVTDLDTDSTDSEIGYPDVASSGPGGGPGHSDPNRQSGSAVVSVVWHHVENGWDKVKCAISMNSGSSYVIYTVESTYGPTTSASLRCVAVAQDESNGNQISILWTDDTDIMFRYYIYSGGSYNLQPRIDWTNSGATDDFVDVSVFSPAGYLFTYSHGVYQEDMQKVYYAREP